MCTCIFFSTQCSIVFSFSHSLAFIQNKCPQLHSFTGSPQILYEFQQSKFCSLILIFPRPFQTSLSVALWALYLLPSCPLSFCHPDSGRVLMTVYIILERKATHIKSPLRKHLNINNQEWEHTEFKMKNEMNLGKWVKLERLPKRGEFGSDFSKQTVQEQKEEKDFYLEPIRAHGW